MSNYAATVEAIFDRIIEDECSGIFDDDAAEWFDEPAFAGFHLNFDLEAYSVRGEEFGGIHGEVVLIDPAAKRYAFDVYTNSYGDVEFTRR
jgi:hypothetical protein